MGSHRTTDQRRRAILDAALECFSTTGYENSSIEEICSISGASIGSVYHHFGSKEGIAAALYEQLITSYQDGLHIELERGGDPDEVIERFVRHHLAWVKANPERARYLLQMGSAPAIVATQPAVHRHNEQLLEKLAAWAEPHAAAGRVVALPPIALLAVVLGSADAVARAWLVGGADLDLRTINEFVAAAVRAARPG